MHAQKHYRLAPQLLFGFRFFPNKLLNSVLSLTPRPLRQTDSQRIHSTLPQPDQVNTGDSGKATYIPKCCFITFLEKQHIQKTLLLQFAYLYYAKVYFLCDEKDIHLRKRACKYQNILTGNTSNRNFYYTRLIY